MAATAIAEKIDYLNNVQYSTYVTNGARTITDRDTQLGLRGARGREKEKAKERKKERNTQKERDV